MPKVSILRIGMAFLHEEEDNHNTTDERKEYGAEDKYSLVWRGRPYPYFSEGAAAPD